MQARLPMQKIPSRIGRGWGNKYIFKRLRKKKEVWSVSIPNPFTGMLASDRPYF